MYLIVDMCASSNLQVKSLPNYLSPQLAPQAIESGIGAIAPSSPLGWPDKAGDALWDMCNHGDGDGVKVPLTVEVSTL